MTADRRIYAAWLLLFILTGPVGANDDPVPPPRPAGAQWTLVIIPDPQAYTQNYGGNSGYLYDGRFDRQTQWVADNIRTLNIRFLSDVGDNVQNNGRGGGEWERAVRALNLLHQNHDPSQPAILPYAVACGNHDYDISSWDSLASAAFTKHLGPGRFHGPDGAIRANVRDWFKGDDLGWEYTVAGRVLGRGAGRNSYQIFSAAGREFLHLTLETAATEQAIAWAKTILAAQAGKPAIVTTHAFIRPDGQFVAPDNMGRRVTQGGNPTNDGQGIFDKLVRDHDQIFMVLCGHLYFQSHATLKNAKGHDVHALEQCYHLNKVGGRVFNQQAPPGGWPSGYQGPDDTQRNGSGWLTVLLFDPAGKTITRYTYSPLLGIWAADRVNSAAENRTFPEGDNVIEQWNFDFDARFGPAPASSPPSTPLQATSVR